jgi:hypothetical protein
MSEPLDHADVFSLWKAALDKPDVQLTLRLAESLAANYNRDKPWWRRRATPFSFIPAAGDAVRALSKETEV